jgi:hypothetical protein
LGHHGKRPRHAELVGKCAEAPLGPHWGTGFADCGDDVPLPRPTTGFRLEAVASALEVSQPRVFEGVTTAFPKARHVSWTDNRGKPIRRESFDDDIVDSFGKSLDDHIADALEAAGGDAESAADFLVSTLLELQASGTPAQTRLVDNFLVNLGREGALKVISEYVNAGRSSRK